MANIDKQKLKNLKNKKLSQDNIFSTLLGLFDIKTKVYEKDMDISTSSKVNITKGAID